MENKIVANKKWYTSKTLYINAIAIVGIFFQSATGMQLVPVQTQATILAILNIILRSFTDSNITL